MIGGSSYFRLVPIGIFSLLLLLLSATVFSQDLSGNTKFSHRLHVVENEIECAECHSSIPESETSQDSNYPSKQNCESCHEGVKELSQYGILGTLRPPSKHPAPLYQKVKFNHRRHLDQGLACLTCHATVKTGTDSVASYRPTMATCMNCHSDNERIDKCSVCHVNEVALSDIHPGDWRHLHGSRALSEKNWCSSCHKSESSCVECHRGDNVIHTSHPPNFRYTHGLDAKSKQMDCMQCHDTRSFCQSCHEENNRIPLSHSTVAWRTEHGRIARSDAENCASCHDVADPTCGRSGCHSDRDGVRGTNPPIHSTGGMLSSKGDWHSDDKYFCFSCHSNSRQSGIGFCGYCHGKE